MELCLSVALALILTRGNGVPRRLFGAAAAGIALAGIVLSKSRGGGLTVLVLGACVLLWGFSGWPVPPLA